MSRVHNGPARNRPKGTARPPVATDPTQCLCPTGPIIVGTFREQQLVDVELRHLRSTGCGMASRHVEVRDFLTELPRRR